MTEVIVKRAPYFAMRNKDVDIAIVIKISGQCFSRDTLSYRCPVCIRRYKGLISNVGECSIAVVPIHRRTGCKEIQIAVVVKVNGVEYTHFC